MNDIDSDMIKIIDNDNDNDNLINKKRKFNIGYTIPPWKEEIIIFIEQFKKIIIYNIYNSNNNNYKTSQNIINSTNFFDTLDDLPFIMPLIYSVIKNNHGIKRYIVYITILFLYYGLILLDQNHDYLYTSDLKTFFKISNKEYDEICNLIFEISWSNKEYASVIRKKMFFYI